MSCTEQQQQQPFRPVFWRLVFLYMLAYTLEALSSPPLPNDQSLAGPPKHSATPKEEQKKNDQPPPQPGSEPKEFQDKKIKDEQIPAEVMDLLKAITTDAYKACTAGPQPCTPKAVSDHLVAKLTSRRDVMNQQKKQPTWILIEIGLDIKFKKSRPEGEPLLVTIPLGDVAEGIWEVAKTIWPIWIMREVDSMVDAKQLCLAIFKKIFDEETAQKICRETKPGGPLDIIRGEQIIKDEQNKRDRAEASRERLKSLKARVDAIDNKAQLNDWLRGYSVEIALLSSEDQASFAAHLAEKKNTFEKEDWFKWFKEVNPPSWPEIFASLWLIIIVVLVVAWQIRIRLLPMRVG